MLVRASCATALGITCLAILGWQFDVAWLRSLVPGAVAMNPLTALSLLLAAGALGSFDGNFSRPTLTRLLAILVAVAGAARLLSLATHDSIPVDQLLFRARVLAERVPSHMAISTACALLLAGLGLCGMSVARGSLHTAARACSVASMAITWPALVGYAYGAGNFSRAFTGPPMAPNSALALFAIALGTLFARPEHGFVRILSSSTPGGILARRALPAALLAPIVVGWLWLVGQREGWYDAEFGAALLASVTLTMMVALVWTTARDLDLVDSDRRRVQMALQSSLARVNCLVQSNIVGVMTATADGWVRQANDAYLEMTGRTPADLPFRWDVTRPAELRSGDATAIAEVLARGASLPRETELVGKDGRRVPVLAGLAALPDEPGTFVAMLLDLSSRKCAEAEVLRMHEALRVHAEKLQSANEELESFSYSVSHDLRGPLRHILGFTNLLRDHAGETLDDKSKRYLDVITGSVKTMGDLIDDLLVFSRMGRSQLQKTDLHLTPIVNEVRSALAPDTAGRTIDWRIEPLPRVQADPAMVKLVFMNLLSNAIKYTRPRSEARIEIGATEDDREVTIHVHDNGVGFDMNYVHKLFGVFQRLHSADEFEGTGIGLANVQRIVRRHGGRAWAESQPDQGATFWFTLPRAHPAALEIEEEAA